MTVPPYSASGWPRATPRPWGYQGGLQDRGRAGHHRNGPKDQFKFLRVVPAGTNWPHLTRIQLVSSATYNNPDQDKLIRAVEDARRILGEYIEPGPRDATRTVERLLAVLDRNDVTLALDRIKRRRVIRLVE